MNELPSTVTKKQAIAYAVVAFNNFINSGNIYDFDISTIETFMTGAMGVHKKNKVVKFSERLEEENKQRMSIKITKLDNLGAM